MIEKYIKKSIAGRDYFLVDGRKLVLSINFNWRSNEEVLQAGEMVFERLVSAFDDRFILDIGTDTRSSVSRKRVMDILAKEVKRGYGAFCYDGIVKTDRIQKKVDFARWFEGFSDVKRPARPGDKELIDSEEASCFHERRRASRLKEILAGLEAKNEVQYFRNMVERILTAECETEDYFVSFPCYDFGLLFQTGTCEKNRDAKIGTLHFMVNHCALEENANEAAEELWILCQKICAAFPLSNGYVCINGTGPKMYASPAMNYFEDFDAGLVFDPEIKKLFDTRTWLGLNYADGLEWGNVFSPRVAEKIKDLDKLQKSENFVVFRREDGGVTIRSRKPLMEYRAKDYEEIYKELRDCLRPGYSKRSIATIREEWDEIYIPPEEYLVDGGIAHFRRGNFNFLTKRWK